jgi:hypothetical protein
MTEQFIYKKEFAPSESMHDSVSCITKKVWQTPKLVVMDYRETKNGANSGSDLFGSAS